MDSVLEGIRVLDLSRHIAGPYATLLLSDFGAEVIRVERPGGEDDRYLGLQGPSGEGFMYMNQARNKKAITLDYTSKEAFPLVLELVKHSDVLVHNFSPGAVRALGLGYDALVAANPGLIYAEITGFGKEGPYADRVAFDQIAQAMSGVMHLTGFPDTPPMRSEIRYVDFSTGMLITVGIMMALYHRRISGKGQKVEADLLKTSVALNGMALSEYAGTGRKRSRIGNRSWYTGPSDLYRARDGRWIYISLATNAVFKRFCRLVGREDLAERPDLASDYHRFQKRHEVDAIVRDWVEERDVADCERQLVEARLPCGIVNDVDEVLADPHVQQSEALIDMPCSAGHNQKLSGVPVRLSDTPGSVKRRPPLLGEHNREIYCGLLGMGDEELEELKQRGIL